MTLFPPGQGFGGGGSTGSGSLQPFSKDVTVLTPTTTVTVVAWRAPFACTVLKVWGYQDTGTGSVVTALHGAQDLLVTDITLSPAGAWQDGGTVQHAKFAAGDVLYAKIVSVSATSPGMLAIQVDLTEP